MREAKKETSDSFELWDMHIPAWTLFQKLRRQFQIVGMGGVTGIPITAKKDLFDIEKIPLDDRSELLEEIQWIEDGALQVMNSKDE